MSVSNVAIKNKLKKYLGRNWSWILSATITAVFMLILMIAGGVTPFGGKSFTLVDSIHQYIPFFSDYQNKLKAGESLFFTWDVGFGQNFLSLLLYYMASPLNLLIVFVAREHIVSLFCILNAPAEKTILNATSIQNKDTMCSLATNTIRRIRGDAM